MGGGGGGCRRRECISLGLGEQGCGRHIGSSAVCGECLRFYEMKDKHALKIITSHNLIKGDICEELICLSGEVKAYICTFICDVKILK